MSHPATIVHHGVNFGLDHLSPSRHSFEWNSKAGKKIKLHAAVLYSAHCYTDESLPFLEGCYSIIEHGKTRVFCEERYTLSKNLKGIMDELFQKPATSAALTVERNWTIYRLSLDGWDPKGRRYHVFFRLKRPQKVVGEDNSYMFDMSVESAYPRDTRVLTSRNAPFGRIAEELVQKE